MEQILNYIFDTYAPLSVILYGSYADGSNNLNSDFDALVIVPAGDPLHEFIHDTSVVGDVRLDVFVYSASTFEQEYDPEDFVQIFDGKIIRDTDGVGRKLQAEIRDYLANRPKKTEAEIQADIDWCLKMCDRAKRLDCEGLYRWHWVLTDSLEIFCDIKGQPYFGPKKTLRWMKDEQTEAFSCYEKALRDFSMESLEEWIDMVKSVHYLEQKSH